MKKTANTGKKKSEVQTEAKRPGPKWSAEESIKQVSDAINAAWRELTGTESPFQIRVRDFTKEGNASGSKGAVGKEVCGPDGN